MDKARLCKAFCGELEVRDVPAGVAVKTAFTALDGDPIGFYITRHPADHTRFRIEDSGLLVPHLEASGLNLVTGARADAFSRLLEEYKATYDEDAGELQTAYLDDAAVPAAAMRFIALMLRLRDLELLNPEAVANTFRQDAEQTMREFFHGKAALKFTKPISDNLADFVPDVTIAPLTTGKQLAVYLATNEGRVDEAVMLWMESQWHNHDFEVAVLLESEKPKIGGRSFRRAINRVNVATYRGDEQGSMNRLAKYAHMDQRLN